MTEQRREVIQKAAEWLNSPDTVAMLRARLAYDPDTGALTWLDSKGGVRKGVRAGCVRKSGYREIKVQGHWLRSARIIWVIVFGELPFPYTVDHRDRDAANDRLENLRLASCLDQARNRGMHRRCRSGVKGVFLLPNGKWGASICANRRRFNLGAFATKEEASEAYARKARVLHGEFAAIVLGHRNAP